MARTKSTRMANMRLDETEGLFVDRGGYKIIIPGNAAQSKLYQKISSTNPAFRMPPVYSGRTLTAEADRGHQAVDRPGRQMGDAMVVRRPQASARARGEG